MYHGRITKHRKKRKFHRGGIPAETKIGKEKKKNVRTKGGGSKLKLISTEYANVVINKKAQKCKIIGFVENPVNQDYSRRGIITRGAIIKVKTPNKKEIKAKVTSRPGQDGVINAISL